MSNNHDLIFTEILIEFCLGYDIPVMGEYPSGASIACGENYEKGWETDMMTIKYIREGNIMAGFSDYPINRFRFVPKRANLLIIDIDRHEGKTDGLEVFYNLLAENNIIEPMLDNIQNGSFPCYVATPNNGFHLYFRYSGNENFSKRLADSVEVFYSDRAFVTVPGSIGKNGKIYSYHGNLNKAPYLFPSLRNLLVPKKENYSKPQPVFFKKYSLNKIAEFVEMDQRWGGRNDKSYLIACRARKEGYHKEQALQFLLTYSGLDGLPESEIISTVISAFK